MKQPLQQLFSYKAFVFDLNGTMIDDMHYHIQAWHRIAHAYGASLSLEQVKAECYGKNHEVLERIFPGRFSEAEKDSLSYNKEKEYQAAFRPYLKLIDGLEEFLKEARNRGIKTAIGSAAIRLNVDFVLDGLNIRSLIDALVSADDVAHSKPHPETFLLCAEKLKVPPQECVVFEDAPKGVEAARNAGMDCVVITTLHQPHEFAGYENVIGFIADFTGEGVQGVFAGQV